MIRTILLSRTNTRLGVCVVFPHCRLVPLECVRHDVLFLPFCIHVRLLRFLFCLFFSRSLALRSLLHTVSPLGVNVVCAGLPLCPCQGVRWPWTVQLARGLWSWTAWAWSREPLWSIPKIWSCIAGPASHWAIFHAMATTERKTDQLVAREWLLEAPLVKQWFVFFSNSIPT